ncbi:MAG: polyphosphate kinase 2 family protein [Acidimicrobiales bacterium]
MAEHEMKLEASVVKALTVEPGKPADLQNRSTTWTRADWPRLAGRESRKAAAKEALAEFTTELETSQELLWASNSHALLLVLQAMDAAGKDGCIKHVMSGVNPQGCEVTSFKVPSAEELAHDFLWRYSKALPARGRIGIFNRSYYEEVLVVRVHPDLIAARPQDAGAPPEAFWHERFKAINAFEEHLNSSSIRIVKVFLHLSYEEQRKRFLKRLEDPDKTWKFSTADLAERKHWADYQAAYEEALGKTSTESAPWYVVPADHKYVARALVGGILVDAIGELKLSYPKPDPADSAELEKAKEELLSDSDSA